MARANLNRPLAGLRLFIGGPIQHALLPTGFSTETRLLISTITATVEEAGATILSAHRVERFGEYTDQFTPQMVAVRDLGWMRQCDVFVPVLPVLPDGTLLRTDGTHVEIGWATALGRPIVVVTQLPFVPSASHLLKGISSVATVRTVDVDDVRNNASCLIDNVLSTVHRPRRPVIVGPEG